MSEEKKNLCPECEQEMPVEAEECPHCGAPISAAKAFNRVRTLADKMLESTKPPKPEKKDPLSGLFGKKK
jgi:predicted amidophosphoribosyltransferase